MHTDSNLDKSNQILRAFIRNLDIDPDRLIAEMSDDTNNVCKAMAMQGLRLERDFSHSHFSPVGVDAANAWLDTIAAKP